MMNARWLPLALLTGRSLVSAPPDTPRKPVTDVYHGVTIVDDFRWLEDGDSAAVKAWSDAQNAHARAVLAKLPGIAPLREKLAAIVGAKRVTHSDVTASVGHLFALRKQPPKQQRFLILLGTGDKPERVLVDPNVFDAKGETAIDWYVPSPDSALVAVSLSKCGSESGDVHVFEVATGKPTDIVIPRVHGGRQSRVERLVEGVFGPSRILERLDGCRFKSCRGDSGRASQQAMEYSYG